MSKEEVIEEGQEGKKGGKGLIIILLVIVTLLLVGMGIMAYLLMSGGYDKKATIDATEMHASAEHEDEAASVNSRAKSYSSKYKQFEPPAPEASPSYFIMDKFVVNFNGNGKAKFLAVDLQFMSYYQTVVGANGEMEHLRPILKNDIQRLLRNQNFTDLDKPDGPDLLRAEILEVARKVLEKHKIYPDLIEDVYMTRFVMQ